jgi:HEAT repeat protein
VAPSVTLEDADGDTIAAAVLNALNSEDRWERSRVIETAARAADPEMLVRAVGDHGDAVRRNAAMDALVRGGHRSVPALVRALDDPDHEVVMFAASLLGKTRDREAIPHLLRLLRYEDVNIVQAAVESLGYLRAGVAVDPLVGLLDKDPWLRLGAIHALGEIGDARAVDPLAAALGDRDAWDLAVAALGKVRSVRAVDHLARTVWSTIHEPELAIAVRGLGDSLRRHPAPEPLWKLESWARLASDGAGALHAQLRQMLDDAASPNEERIAVGEGAAILVRMLRLESLYVALVRAGRIERLRPAIQFCTLAIGGDIGDALAEGLRDPDEAVRAFATRCAGGLRLERLATPLIARLEDASAEVREHAVRALGQIGASRAAPSLAEMLLDPAGAVRAAAQEALACCDPGAASDALLAFPNREPSVALAMLRVMRAAPHPNQLPFVLDCMRGDAVEIRKLAVETIAEQPELDLVDLLSPILEDPADEVRAAVIRVVGRRRTARAQTVLLDRLCRDPACAALIVETLVAMEGPSVQPRLIEAHDRSPPQARLAILEALAAMREPAAEPLVVSLLADQDPDVRRTAVRAAARFEDPFALRHVIAAGTDPAWQVRATVAEVLSGIDHPDALQELERLSLDDHPFVATTARHRLEAAGA